MSNTKKLTDYYEISDYLLRKEMVRASKDFSALTAFEQLSVLPDLDAVRKAEDVIYWNNKDIESCQRRIEYYLDEIEKLRKCIKSSEKIIKTSSTIIDIYNIRKDLDKTN